MMKETKVYFFIGGVVFILMLWLACSPAQAGRYTNITNNYYETTEVTEVSNMSITAGIDADDLAKGLAAAFAAGSMQFDFGTYSYQAGVSAAFDVGENTDAVSFGLAKRFKGLDALFHGTYTRNGDQDWVTIGTTWRF